MDLLKLLNQEKWKNWIYKISYFEKWKNKFLKLILKLLSWGK